MNGSMILARSDFRKTKAQTVAVFVLITVAALLINLCLMVSIDYQKEYDVLHRELNEGDVTMIVSGSDSEVKAFERDCLAANGDVDSYQISPVQTLVKTVSSGSDERSIPIFYAISKSEADSKSVGKYRYEQTTDGSGIFLPYQSYASGKYKVGDRFVINYDGKCLMDTTVRGFFSCAMTSGIHILTDDLYEALALSGEFSGNVLSSAMVSVRLTAGADCAMFEYDTASAVTRNYSGIDLLTSNNTETVKSHDYTTQIVSVAVLAVAGLFFEIVSAVMIAFNITLFINTNMKSFGMLKAMGYRSRKLRGTILAELSGVGLLAVLTGTALSYAVFPRLNRLMESVTGIPYPVRFAVKPLLIAFAVIMPVVLVTAWAATVGIKRLPPISAIRNVSTGKRQKRNHLPVETSGLPIDLNLALKSALLNWKQNIIVFVTLVGISYGSVFCITMYRNIVQDREPFIELNDQNAHSCVNISSDADGAFREMLDADRRVENYYVYTNGGDVVIGDTVLSSTVADDCTKIKNQTLVFSGVMPSKACEVAVGALYAEKNGVSLGDTVTVSAGGDPADYKVTALIQRIGNSGNDIVFVTDGYEKIREIGRYSYLITLGDYGDLPSFNEDVKRSFADADAIDYKKSMENSTENIARLMRFIIIGIIVLCVSLIVFVLYILIKILLFRKQREYSIMKSVGYTSKTLVKQTALSFLPVVIVSLAVSLPLAVCTINGIFSVFLHDLGMFRTVFRSSALWTVLAGVLTAALSFALLCLFSLKIRNYSPKQLLND